MVINKDILVLSVAKMLQVGIALVSIKILTELLSKDEVGNYYLLLTILTLFNFAFLNPIGQYYSRQIIRWQQSGNLHNATFVLMLLRVLLIFSAVLTAYFIYTFFDYGKYYSKTEFLIFIFISLIAGTHGVLLSAINLLGDRFQFAKFLIFTLITSLTLAVLITFYIDRSAMGWLYGFAVAQILFLYPLYKRIVFNQPLNKKKIISVFQPEFIKKIALFAIPISLTLFLQWGQSTAYRFIVESKYSLEAVALIGVGIAVATAIFGAVESLATQFYNPIYLRKITNASKEKRIMAWNEMAGFLIPIYLLLTVFVISLSPHLIKLLVSDKFAEAFVYTLFGAAIELFRVLTNTVYLVSQSEIDTRLTILPYAAGFILTLTILSTTDFSHMLWMVPVVLSATQALIFSLMYINMRKLLRIKIDMITVLKTLIISIPMLMLLIPEFKNSLIQSLLFIGAGGVYFLLMVYMVTEKRVLERRA